MAPTDIASTAVAQRWLAEWVANAPPSLARFADENARCIDALLAADTDDTLLPSVRASIAVCRVAVKQGAGAALVLQLLRSFLLGDLHGTNLYSAPFSYCEEHATACTGPLLELNALGVYTNNGQERNETPHQRGYVSGTFIVASDKLHHLRRLLDAADSCYCAIIQVPSGKASMVRMMGSDEGHMGDIDAEFVCVTVDAGEPFTHVYIDEDPYELGRYGLGYVVDFMMWDPTWPSHGEQVQPAVDSRLACAIRAHPGVLVCPVLPA